MALSTHFWRYAFGTGVGRAWKSVRCSRATVNAWPPRSRPPIQKRGRIESKRKRRERTDPKWTPLSILLLSHTVTRIVLLTHCTSLTRFLCHLYSLTLVRVCLSLVVSFSLIVSFSPSHLVSLSLLPSHTLSLSYTPCLSHSLSYFRSSLSVTRYCLSHSYILSPTPDLKSFILVLTRYISLTHALYLSLSRCPSVCLTRCLCHSSR